MLCRMKPIFRFFSLILLSSVASAQLQLPKNESIPIDGYVAQVNDRVITRGEVVQMLAPMLPELYQRFQGEALEIELEKAFKKVRGELIERALIMEAFKKRGGDIPDQYVNDEIDRVISSRYKGDAALFEQALTSQKKTREEFMEEIREQMSVGMMFSEEVARRARITPEQVREAYEKNKERYFIPEKVKHSVILLNKGTTDEDQAVKRQEAESIRQRLVEGADFAETAKKSSEGGRAADGGAFPWMQPKDVRPELVEVLATLPAGQISQIIESEKEFYIVKLDARRQSGYKTFDEVRKELEAELVETEKQRLKERWMDRLTKENYVRIYD